MVLAAPHAAEELLADKIWFSGEPSDVNSQAYLLEVAAESGLGEIFVATDRPLPKGSVVELSFPVKAGMQAAKGIVAWSRFWFGPRGMQVKLFEVEGPRRQPRRRRSAELVSNS